MAQIGATADKSKACLRHDWLKVPQRDPITFILGVVRAFPNIKAVDKYRVLDVSRIVPSIKAMIAHQHMQPVDASGQERNTPSGRCWSRAAAPFRRLDRRHLGPDTAPARPPRVSSVEALDQHRTRSRFYP